MSPEDYDLDRLSLLADDPRKVMLFIDAEVPQYDIAAGYFIIYEYLRIFLKNGYKILYWPFNRMKIEPYNEELEGLGIDVVHGDIPFQDFIARCGRRLDLVIICRPEIAAAYLDLLSGASSCPIVYFAHDLHFLRLSRLARVTASEEDAGKALQTKLEELGAMKKADISLFLSEKEVDVVREEDPSIRTAAIPWIQPLNDDRGTPFEERQGLVYLGGFLHTPNIDSVKWLHGSIFPLIREKLPDVGIEIIGSNIPDEIRELDGEAFRIRGYVRDLGDPLRRTRAFLAPIRFGAGIKGKIAMAQSYGLPVVTTSIGAEGMHLTDGETALIADEPEPFADKVALLYNSRELWESISQNSLEHIAGNYSPAAAERAVMPIIDELAGEHGIRGMVRKVRRKLKRK